MCLSSLSVHRKVSPPLLINTRPSENARGDAVIEEVVIEDVITGKDEGSLFWRQRVYMVAMKSIELIGHGTNVDVHKVGTHACMCDCLLGMSRAVYMGCLRLHDQISDIFI